MNSVEQASTIETTDVAIIGAGPSGAIAAGLLRKNGHKVTILERQHFPRFSIGESLLPHCMQFIEEAGMLDAINHGGFQFKNGAAFIKNGNYTCFDFTKKFSTGPGTTFQVQRAKFDHLLAQEAETAGADLRYGHSIEAVKLLNDGAELTVSPENAETYTVKCNFLLDASGFGRVLPRLLDLEAPSNFPSRTSVFTHIEDNIAHPDHDRDKILITVHPENNDIWYWLIPFGEGRSSIGVVLENKHLEGCSNDNEATLKQFISEAPDLNNLLNSAKFDTPVQRITGYSSNVKSLWGDNFALLGNAGEFLDPVFSSGVTIAMRSASMAAPLVSKQLNNETVDWENDYAKPLKQGVNTFRTYVEAWYDGRFQDIIFTDNEQSERIREMISSILAGYAWDTENPYVAEAERRLNTLVEVCHA
ncbi:MAG: tryptophan 7-halogenase [Cellvibrionaceae bacterium]